MCSAVIISLLPVVVTKMSAVASASSTVVTWKPAMHACNAQMGSTSETITRAFSLASESAEPFPTSPNPQTIATFPEMRTSRARLMPSTKECLQP